MGSVIVDEKRGRSLALVGDAVAVAVVDGSVGHVAGIGNSVVVAIGTALVGN